MVGGRPTLRCRSEPPCLTISVMAALKLNGDASAIGIHPEQDMSELDRLGVLDGNLANDARQLRVERVHDLHRFDDAQRLPHADPAAHPHIRVRSRLGARVEGPHHGGLHFEPVPPLVLHTTGGRSGRGGGGCRSRPHGPPPPGGGGGGGGGGAPARSAPPRHSSTPARWWSTCGSRWCRHSTGSTGRGASLGTQNRSFRWSQIDGAGTAAVNVGGGSGSRPRSTPSSPRPHP